MKPEIETSQTESNQNLKTLKTNSKFERKRTANLESLIGNLKVRKMSQHPDTPSSQTSGSAKRDNKLHSLYVEVTNSLSDCSRSTPPLSSSSPSVSPSSISPDSPIQCNVSSSLSSLSSSSLATASNNSSFNLNTNKSRSLLPKFRWMMESEQCHDIHPNNLKQEIEEEEEELEEEIKNEDLTCNENSSLSPNSVSKYQEQESLNITNWPVKNEQQIQPESIKKLTQKQLKQQQKNQQANKNQDAHLNYKITSQNQNTKNQNEDRSRAVKFYDDFIDFRGDILRRPPNSKNCRILWEYLFLLLQDTNYTSVIKWEDETKMVFRIVQAEKLAALWGLQKNRLGMTYEKLSRGMRYYYPNNIIAREPGRRLLYRFMRHPDEIKKFVKKNGTYMLKKAKINGKNNDAKSDLNPDDSGVDEPSLKTNKNKCDEDLDEEFVDEENEQIINQDCDDSDDKSLSPKSCSNNKNGDLLVNKNQSSTSSTPSTVLGQFGQKPNQFYTDFYQYVYQAQMAAAAMGLPAHVYFSRLLSASSSSSNNIKDEMNASQYLMQLRAQAEAANNLIDPNQNLQLESLKNLANTLTNSLNRTNSNQNDFLLKLNKQTNKSNGASNCSNSSSSYSSSSSTHSLESEFNQNGDMKTSSNNNNNNYKINDCKISNLVFNNSNNVNNEQYPLNLSINNIDNKNLINPNNSNNTNNKKRKSKYDITKFESELN